MLASDLLDKRVAEYIIAVIMAPLPDSEQTQKNASDLLAALHSGRVEAYWIMAGGKRCGVIAFSVGPYSSRPDEAGIRVLYVQGIAFPKNAPASAWHRLIDDGCAVAKEKGCRCIMFDVAPGGPHTEGIINAALEAKARARFTLEV